MSPDANRPRPRSSKKRRAVQSDGGRARPAGTSAGGSGSRGQRSGAIRTTGGSTSSGIPTLWLAAIAVVVFAIGVGLASGVFGGAKPGATTNVEGFGASGEPGASADRGDQPSNAASDAAAGGGSSAPRGTNCPTSQPPAAPAGQTRVVTIETAKGQIQITLKADLSPIAVGNFAALAGCGFYDGVVFHRVATLQDGTPFVIQGGDPTGTGSGGPGYEIQDEPVTTPYIRGTVAMARTSAPNSVGSQFFIVLDDKDQEVLASANTYQIIGSVTAGMDTADAIYQAAGGQELPPDPVVMTKVTISNP